MMANEPKRDPAISATILTEPSGTPYGLRLEFANGQTLSITKDQLDANIRAYATIHGLKQKLGDAAAIPRNPDTGRSATIDDKYAAVREVYDRLIVGEWNKRRGDGGTTGAGGLLFRALCRLYATKTPDQIRGFLNGKTKEEQAALRKNPRVAGIIETIKAESAKSTDVDSDDMLADLED